MKADPKIGKRAASEACRLWPSAAAAVRDIGCGENTIYAWQRGMSPSAVHLAELHARGADVMWILTGRKNAMDENTAYEQTYKNGKEAMRGAIVSMLRVMKGWAIGRERTIINEIIEKVQKLEVRP